MTEKSEGKRYHTDDDEGSGEIADALISHARQGDTHGKGIYARCHGKGELRKQ